MLNFSNPALDQLYAAAVQHHMAGRHAEAERAYRQVLALAPNHADSWHMLGALACQLGKYDAAVELMERAVALNPCQAAYRSNLGEAYRQAGKPERAAEHFKAAIALDPKMANAHTNLAALYLAQERYAEALQAVQAGIPFMPDNAVAQRFMGDALVKLKRYDEALQAYERALALQPDLTDARFNAALLLSEMGRREEAASAFRMVVAATPHDWEAWLQLVDMLDRLGRAAEAHQEVIRLVQRNPKYAPAHGKLANILRNGHHIDEALAAYAQAAALAPAEWITRANMAFALRDLARLEESLALQRELLAQHPDASALHSGLIFTMHLVPGLPREDIQREQALWNRRYGDPVAAQRGGYTNDRNPARCLRIGYMSADFRSHPVGWFMLPLLKNHDRTQVEVFCFQASRAMDALTGRIQAVADRFVPLGPLSDDEAAAAIRAAGIDILVDLNNHTIDNRMPVLARKPAPVQISYLAYGAGTGLETIDWRLTDAFIDPIPAPDDALPFEKPLRLAETYWCYAAHPTAGAVQPLPALAAGHVTFGSFNYFAKCNDQVLALWARLLAEIPGTRFMLSVPVGSRQAYVREFFAARGIAPERLTLVGRIKEELYFRNYGLVDIALDPFPWAGGTTTCDALWMGVPVITWGGAPGQTLQRGGVSILSNLGCPEWIAGTPDEYIAKARALAADLPRLAEIRAGLRGRMQRSVLMDAPRFARHVEAAYRRAWEAWCGAGACS